MRLRSLFSMPLRIRHESKSSWLEESHENTALRWLRQHDEREYSFVDATSFALMRAHRLSDAFAFDGDFTAAGFIELRA